ncbi:hypothetical protein ACFYO7_06365 [Nocardia salmonicida]|uniref:hypothetical protein n=1 Tax=Nocardia salmonicida TaxID=53431 RepID=UPI0036C28499
MNTRADIFATFDREQLLKDFQRYDRDVDIVSIYHWLFTETDLAPTVRHFERYPRVKAADGNRATPDFSVLFNDGSGIVGEIANTALHDNSIEKLCKQLGRYDSLNYLPCGPNRLCPAKPIDVIFLSPMETAADAVHRIMIERHSNPSHPYKPARKPVVVQFARTPDKYVLQKWPDPELIGQLFQGSRSPSYTNFGTLNVPPYRFSANKVRFAFMNDTVAPLYLATRLWASVFPTDFRVAIDEEFETTTQEIVSSLRRHYEHGKADDVRAAMSVLSASALATPVGDNGNKWVVKRRKLRDKNMDVHKIIVDRIGRISVDNPPQKRRTSSTIHPGQFSLF